MTDEITVKRRVQTLPYESVEVGYTRQIREGEDPDTAFNRTARKVDEWIDAELISMGLAPRER